MYHYVVKHPFAGFVVGDHLTDPDQIARFTASHPEYLVRKLAREDSASTSTSGQSQTVPQLKPIG